MLRLTDQFRFRFTQLLEDECVPIRAGIQMDLEATITELNSRSYKDKYFERVHKEFAAMLDRLSRANNIYEAISMQTESDRLKQRYIQMFIDEQARQDAVKPKPDNTPPAPVRKTKTVTVKALFSGTNQISSKADIDRLLGEIRRKLEAQLEENTTIQII